MRSWLIPGLLCALTWTGLASDWLHWRGPEQNGTSRDTGLPAEWSASGLNVIWKQPYGGRSTPVICQGRVYIINGAEPGNIREQERVMCFDADTGKLLWEYRFNIFHTDIVTNRVGWANLAADAETGYVYAHGIQGLLFCFSPDGKVVWSRSLTEEYGRISGYGGRVTTPLVDEDRLIMHFLNASWGNQARGGHRFVAFDKRTGEVLWWSEPGDQPVDTLYSVPVVAVINGERLIICGGADGALHALQSRTGKPVWSYAISKRGINPSPVVAGSRVYITHGDENLDTNEMGGVYCLDAAQVQERQPKLLWRRLGILAGLASPALCDNRIYVADNSAKLFCLDAWTGETIWEHKYGTMARGSPVWADGKIYIMEVAGKFHILQPSERGCKTIHSFANPLGPQGEIIENNGSPAVWKGRLYFTTGDSLYCLGTKESRAGKTPPSPAEPLPDAKDEPAWLQLIPADVVLEPGQQVKFRARIYNARGQLLGEVSPDQWSLPAPDAPAKTSEGKPAPQPPPLRGTIAAGVFTADPKIPAQHGYVEARWRQLTARARVRVAPLIPLSQTFDALPEGAVPGGWVNVAGKFQVTADPTNPQNKVLKKLANNPNPLLARALAYITGPQVRDYTIEADLMANERRRNLPDMGVINSRYSLTFDGNKQRLLLRTWEARRPEDAPMDAIPGRINAKVDYSWKPGIWYRFKLRVQVVEGKGVLQGKVWPRQEPEPADWTITAEDPVPNTEGAAGLYAYATGITANSPGAEAFFDNVRVYPNR
ncbi:MAG: PQQ-binding-like beta-propeller repeat protein [Gemmatales bacterium]|nr:PQQ-binding-like beta-propeller repeat protein [Gemmatales bacterium]MDW8175965.1 PQQ-binding-like beta-propeller repeat protein [Gemmatales bacterium]